MIRTTEKDHAFAAICREATAQILAESVHRPFTAETALATAFHVGLFCGARFGVSKPIEAERLTRFLKEVDDALGGTDAYRAMDEVIAALIKDVLT